jgi:hypothetical protein
VGKIAAFFEILSTIQTRGTAQSKNFIFEGVFEVAFISKYP